MTEKVNRIVELVNELQEFIGHGVINIEIDQWGKKEIFYTTEEFIGTFTNFDIVKRSSHEYPYEAKVEIDGVNFFALLDQEEYDRYVYDLYVKGGQQFVQRI